VVGVPAEVVGDPEHVDLRVDVLQRDIRVPVHVESTGATGSSVRASAIACSRYERVPGTVSADGDSSLATESTITDG